ncbi:undecaprenyl-phosphate glucose phosphotransferase [Corallococcus sp. CA047B]|uniref:undecaprenyl-phosphate glucose phosphotransferase n=1 Tax=Corallococcus sp. CA047B TaxID=2316729 RepID=UPI000EA0D0D9|nr:undecaprenyl-phosphate glucose phosphotransferase [Corallococcus sp. CA047B]RKG96949.1 undecaprenyl-phosphate glucose phosphotransferase [Corallococcus sp. CA047B]
MFGRLQRFYTSIKVAADAGMLAVAFVLAYFTRFSGVMPITEGIPPPGETFVSLVMVLVIFPVTFRQARLYATNRSRTHMGELFELFKATITATLVLVAVTYFIRERYSRLTIAIFVVYAFTLIALSRLAFRHVLSEVRRRGYNLKSILVIGAGDLGLRTIETVESHRELGFRVVGVLSLKEEKVGQWVGGVRVVDHVRNVEAYLDAHPVDQVIIAMPLEDQAQVKPLMEQLALRTVDVKVVPDLFQYITLYGGLEEFGGLPIISLQGDPMDGWSRVAKRVFDVLFSLLAILVSAPVMAATALVVWATSRGPILYRQERMGMDGRTFPILKFRTMRVDAEVQGATMASAVDARRTPVGTFLRKYSLDELPQFFNVLRGDMSLVGPRPERPVFIEEFKRQIPRYHLRHKVKAGITGWAQINGLRGQTSIQKRIEYDLYYIENWSLLMDLKILLRTALGGFLSKNAY